MLEIKGITVCYDKVPVLKDVSISVKEREVVAFLGLNGAGKTSTLMTVSGFLKPISGEIWFRGRRIDGMPPHKVVRLGLVHIPEGRRVFSTLKVWENLVLGAYTRNDRNIRNDLEEVGKSFPILKERKWQLAGSLSGGEQQMLAFGRGIMARPQLFMMDEPNLGLSPLMIQEVGRIINGLILKGFPILLVEQNIDFVLKFADRCYVLERGKIVFEASSSELSSTLSSVSLKKILFRA